MLNKVLFIFSFFLISIADAQQLTGIVKGRVADNFSKQSIPFASLQILYTDSIIGTTSDQNGDFIIENIPIGRYNLKVSYLGYEPIIIPELVVTSTKDLHLDVMLTESTFSLEEVIIKPKLVKSQPINEMASVSARMLSVEEASK